MFAKLARLMYRRRWYVIGIWFVILAIALTQAVQVGKILGPGDFVLKGSDSQRASDILDQKFHQNDLKVSLVPLYNPHATIHNASYQAAVASTVRRIRADRGLHIQYLDNPLISHNPQLISKDGHGVIILISSSLKEQDIEGQIDHLRSITTTPGFTSYVTGTPAINHDYAIASKEDLSKSESFTVPILLIILLLVFGAVVSAVLPLVLAAFSIVLSLALVFLFGHFVDTSVYVTNVVTVLGLGIAIDYSLFIVYRFREEIEASSGDREAAIVRTMETTGRAVFFSGLTVAIGLSSLILTKLSFMESMGLGGMLVPFTAVTVAMTLLPAMLGVLGPNINRLRVLPGRFLASSDTGMWHRLAMLIMRRPWVSGGAVLAIMLALAFPLTQLQTAPGSLKNAGTSLSSIAGFDFVQAHFNSAPDPAQIVVLHRGSGTVLQPSEIAGIRTLERQLRQDPEAARVQGPTDYFGTDRPSQAQVRPLLGRLVSPDLQAAIITIIPKHDAGTHSNQSMVARIRQDVVPFKSGAFRSDEVHVGGASAPYTDFTNALFDKFPIIIVIVLCLTYGFLFFAFRSVFLPFKAVLLNLLSVGAAYGVLELVFQRGVGASLLSFTPESGVASWVPIFLFAFLFGLSMDYEVFLLSRVREHWLETEDNRESVAFGLEKTGRLISSAALIMVVAFSGFLIGREVQLKEFGFAMAASVAIDATLIRLVLVPAIMEIMGSRNWWVPRRLRAWANRGSTFSESGAPAPHRDPEPEPVSAY